MFRILGGGLVGWLFITALGETLGRSCMIWSNFMRVDHVI